MLNTGPLPDFNERGLLPPGFHTTSIAEFKRKLGFNAKRLHMIDRGLEPVLRELKVRKVTQLFVNGSFVTANPDLRTSTLMYWSPVERVLYSGGLAIVQGNGEKYMALSVSPLSKESLAQDRRLIGKSCSVIKTARQKASSS